MNKTLLKILNLITFIIMLAINVLAITNLFGTTTSEVATSIPTLIMPLTITFSIVWTIIYLMLLIYMIYQLFKPNDTGIYLVFANLLNALWVLSFNLKLFFVSLVVIVVLDITLFILVDRLNDANRFVKTTFSIYHAWINVATLIAVFSFISSVDPAIYNSLAIRIATGIAIIITMVMAFVRIKDLPYVLTVLFALGSILIRQIIEFKAIYPELCIVTGISIIMIVSGLIINMPSKQANKLVKGVN